VRALDQFDRAGARVVVTGQQVRRDRYTQFSKYALIGRVVCWQSVTAGVSGA
jgi:hypothetical protein